MGHDVLCGIEGGVFRVCVCLRCGYVVVGVSVMSGKHCGVYGRSCAEFVAEELYEARVDVIGASADLECGVAALAGVEF